MKKEYKKPLIEVVEIKETIIETSGGRPTYKFGNTNVESYEQEVTDFKW